MLHILHHPLCDLVLLLGDILHDIFVNDSSFDSVAGGLLSEVLTSDAQCLPVTVFNTVLYADVDLEAVYPGRGVDYVGETALACACCARLAVLILGQSHAVLATDHVRN